ncbi:MAG: alpha/beta hydrolase [Acidimicrobiales bacterium]|nr:alpha/beta hydrolase [Acidimicrobiales bacterium]RZV48144.1 MAG: alpha/beta hydrolase [Acidimicrobiales bacterium]
MIDNDGIRLALSVEGDGPDLLFVHGLGSAQLLWRPLIAALRDRYRCWNLDLRGHGASDRAPGYNYAGYTSDVAAALDHIGAPTIGIGHSLGGGSLTRAAAAGHPNLSALYAIDSAILRRERAPGTLRIFETQLKMLREFQPENRPVDDYEAVLAAAPYRAGGTNRDHMIPEQLRGRAESLSQLDPECLEAVVEGKMTGDFVAPDIAIPMRVLAADPELGASFRPEWHDELRRHAPQATTRTLEGVGHQMLMMQGFDDVVRADLEDWLATLT